MSNVSDFRSDDRGLTPIWHIPYQRNEFFMGREDVLTHLHCELQVGNRAALTQPQSRSDLERVTGALEKLQSFFAALDQWKFAHKRLILAYLPVWYGDENAIVRNKLYQARVKRLTPWLEEIIQQGAGEGVFTTPYPDQAARIVISLLEDVGYASIELLTAETLSPEERLGLQRILLATTDAMEHHLVACNWAMLGGLEQWMATQADS